MPKIVDHVAMRQQIAKIACQTIANSGLENTTIREVARAAGCSTGFITHYFPYKNALVIAAIKYVSARQLENMGKVAEFQPGDIFAIFLRGLPIEEEDKIAFKVWLALWSMSCTNIELASVQRQIHRDYLGFYSTTLLNSGVLNADDELLNQAERISLMINGLSIQALHNPFFWSAERLASEFEVILRQTFPLWAGIKPDNCGPSSLLVVKV